MPQTGGVIVMWGWAELTLSLLAFGVGHAVPVRPPVRAALVRQLGARGFTAAYSLLSVAILGWVIVAAGRAPHVPLWEWTPWRAAVPFVAMAAVCALLAFGAARPNPFSFGGRDDARFDPTRAGIIRWVRHPLLLALAIWALAHVIANGDLAHVAVFGLFAAFAVLGMWIVDRRKRRLMGAAWDDMRARLRAAPRVQRPLSWPGAMLRLGVAVGVYGALLWGHGWFAGVVPVWPW
ncbi:MAG: NnrU family protein [Sediminimonas sp.]|uniref:NnrU family protein n=1 Tax=Sediminimonas sp. TaxID=2823379 RepID=UPI0028700638|nr:NnrU family protein [Sediminimonas sp.]MDR9484180.1 NnrU family protein [Sediminimonas sp.]